MREFDKHVDQGVLHKLKPDERFDWVSTLVCIKKPNDSLSLCLDPRLISKYLICPVQNTDTLEDVLPQFVGARYFTVLDAKSRFWHLELEKKPKSLTTMATMFSHYCWQNYALGCPVAWNFSVLSSKSSTREETIV